LLFAIEVTCADHRLREGIMRIRVSAGKALCSAVLAAGAALVPAAPATAGQYHYFLTYAFGTCDTTTGQWEVDWQLVNQSDEPATVTEVAAAPAERPIEALPTSVDGGATAHATQRLPGTPGITSSLIYTTRWADGTTTMNNWAFRPRTLCTKST
jgi:hypothetical protein